jgi:hypothetical protein
MVEGRELGIVLNILKSPFYQQVKSFTQIHGCFHERKPHSTQVIDSDTQLNLGIVNISCTVAYKYRS